MLNYIQNSNLVAAAVATRQIRHIIADYTWETENMRLYELNDLIREKAEQVQTINSVHFSSVEILNDKQVKYPACVCDLDNSTWNRELSDGLIQHNIVLYFADRMRNEENPWTIWQTAQEALIKIVMELKKSDDILDITDENVIQYFRQEFDDINAGAYMTVGITVKNEINTCYE